MHFLNKLDMFFFSHGLQIYHRWEISFLTHTWTKFHLELGQGLEEMGAFALLQMATPRFKVNQKIHMNMHLQRGTHTLHICSSL